MSRKIQINGIGFHCASVIYMYISIVIFLVLWVKPIYSILSISAIIFAFFKYYNKTKKNLKNCSPIYVSIGLLLLIFIIIILLGILLGWTGKFKQADDWYKHNSILMDLTNKSWPVYYENGNEKSMLTYYLGQYIVPGFVGKLFSSFNVAQITNGIWAMIGLFIAILGVFKITKSDNKEKQLATLIIIMLFSSCVTLSQDIGKLIIPDKVEANGHWFTFYDNYKLQLSSNIVLLRWVMPQCIIPWIILSLLYDNRSDIQNYALIAIPSVFYATLPAIGIIISLITFVFIKAIKEKKILKILKEIFSISNVIILLTLGLILIAYFSGNIFSEKPKDIGIAFLSYGGENVLIYLIFILCFVPYTILLFKNNKKNSFYWIATILLLILPFMKIGLYNDLLMRTSIISLYIYMILCIKELYNNNSKLMIKIMLMFFLVLRKLFRNK